jgi:acetyl esterase
VYFHGGAAISGTAEMHNDSVSRYVIMCEMTVVNVCYRLAPEAKAPEGINDGYAATKWVIQNAKDLGINPERIAIGGESGGGYITAGVAMRLA